MTADACDLIAQARRELWWFIETYTDEDEDTVARAMSIQDELLYPALQAVERNARVRAAYREHFRTAYLRACGRADGTPHSTEDAFLFEEAADAAVARFENGIDEPAEGRAEVRIGRDTDDPYVP